MPTYQTFTAIGMREDLSDVIYNISPTETPIMSSIGKTSATAVYHEWQTDTLATATTANAAVEGADATSITDWGTNARAVVGNGDAGMVTQDEYLAVFYPNGITVDLTGNKVVVPASHMMLKTIAPMV